MQSYLITLFINEKEYVFKVGENDTLLDTIREKAGLTGTKKGCDCGQCGACTVILDGNAVNSCSILALQADGKHITTIEGLSPNGEPHPIQEAFAEEGAVQCGFCTPGMVMSAKALLDHEPNPTDSQIREALSGNICRCTGYTKIEQAVKTASKKISKDKREGKICE